MGRNQLPPSQAPWRWPRPWPRREEGADGRDEQPRRTAGARRMTRGWSFDEDHHHRRLGTAAHAVAPRSRALALSGSAAPAPPPGAPAAPMPSAAAAAWRPPARVRNCGRRSRSYDVQHGSAGTGVVIGDQQRWARTRHVSHRARHSSQSLFTILRISCPQGSKKPQSKSAHRRHAGGLGKVRNDGAAFCCLAPTVAPQKWHLRRCQRLAGPPARLALCLCTCHFCGATGIMKDREQALPATRAWARRCGMKAGSA